MTRTPRIIVRQETKVDLRRDTPGITRLRLSLLPPDRILIGTTAGERAGWRITLPYGIRATTTKRGNRETLRLVLDAVYRNIQFVRFSPEVEHPPLVQLLKIIGTLVAKEWKTLAPLLRNEGRVVETDESDVVHMLRRVNDPLYAEVLSRLATESGSTVRELSAQIVLTRKDFRSKSLVAMPESLLTDFEHGAINLIEEITKGSPRGKRGKYGVGEGSTTTMGFHDRKGGD